MLEHYLSEVKRVLGERGRLHATFFLLNSERERRFRDSDAELANALMSSDDPARSPTEIPEWMVAYEEDWLRALFDDVGLKLRLINYGSWPEWALGLEQVMAPQDTIVAYASDMAARSRGA